MKTLTARFFVAAFIFATAAVAFANPPKSKIITDNDSTLVLTVPDDHFLKITNFTQDGGTDRAVVEVTLSGLCWSMAPRAQQATLRSALRTASLAIFAQRYHHVDRSWASLQRVSSGVLLSLG